MRLGWNVKETSVRIRGLAKVAVLLTLAVYTVIYLVQPFSDIWNTILSNLFLVIAASFAAGIATMVWACYDETDVPRHVWRNFAIGLWLWTAAELIWGYLNVTQ